MYKMNKMTSAAPRGNDENKWRIQPVIELVFVPSLFFFLGGGGGTRGEMINFTLGLVCGRLMQRVYSMWPSRVYPILLSSLDIYLLKIHVCFNFCLRHCEDACGLGSDIHSRMIAKSSRKDDKYRELDPLASMRS